MHGDELGDQAHDAEGARDGQAADDPGECGRDHRAEHEEQHHADQWDGGHLGALLVLADGAGQLTGQRLQAGLLHADAVDVQCLFDGLAVFADVLVVVVQDLVVVVALQLHGHEGLLLVCVRHVLQQLGALEVTDRAENLVGVVLLDLGEVVQDLLLERRIVDRLAVGRGVDGDDVARGVAPVGLVADHRRVHRLAAVVVEATLCDVLAQADAVDAATKAECDHDSDHRVPESVHRSTPPGEHVSS